MTNNIKYIAEDVTGALDVLEDFIQAILLEVSKSQAYNTVAIQLKEISKAIEKLENMNIPIPSSLLNEKSNLLSMTVQPSTPDELLKEVHERLNALIKSMSKLLKNSKGKAKSRMSQLPMTKLQILRECILIALESLGGSAHRREIIDHVGNQLKDSLLPGDMEWRANLNAYVWQDRLGCELTNMRVAGILKPKVKIGIWELEDNYLNKEK